MMVKKPLPSPHALKVHVITMGCAKNVVDSEKLMAQLQTNNIELTPTIEGADVAVVNTCGFIEAAKQESIDAILAQVDRKAGGKLKKVYAMGCLTERYRDELRKEIPEVDRYFGSHHLPEVVKELGATYKYELLGERVLSTPTHVAYLKISEGCDHPCSFCAIPIMRGRHVSRPLDDIVAETNRLSQKGVKEIVVVGQDTTCYGKDLYGRRRLADLLERLGEVDGIEWIRLMYAYPAKFPKEVLDIVAQHPKVCRYLDIPIQHAADEVLRSMRRGVTRHGLTDLLQSIRETAPEIALRTTLIVGYPAESPQAFDELLAFVGQMEFERLGVFPYSHEDGTSAYSLGDTVPGDEKQRRMGLVMELQREISLRKNESLIGTRRKVLIDRAEENRFVGRTEWDAPEIDNEVYVEKTYDLRIGEFCSVDIVDAYEYDLVGVPQESHPPSRRWL